MAIIEYLDETRGAPHLLPKADPVKRQQVCVNKVVLTMHVQTMSYSLYVYDAGSSSIWRDSLWNTTHSGI